MRQSRPNIDSTGIHIIAATFLLPLGVGLYTFVGGIKATLVKNLSSNFSID